MLGLFIYLSWQGPVQPKGAPKVEISDEAADTLDEIVNDNIPIIITDVIFFNKITPLLDYYTLNYFYY